MDWTRFFKALLARISVRRMVGGLVIVLVIAFIGYLLFGFLSEIRLKRDLRRWGLPTDLAEKQLQLDTLSLPNAVDRVDWLHSGLKHLDVSHTAVRSLRGLQSNLESLDLSHSAVTSLRGLPASLKTLGLEGIPVTEDSEFSRDLRWPSLGSDKVEAIPRLPAGLEGLKLAGLRLDWKDLAKLPRGLRCLAVETYSLESLEGLPPDLTFLSAPLRSASELSDLPEKLDTLDITFVGTEHLEVSSLPHFLSTLRLELKDPKGGESLALSKDLELPRYLQSLTVENVRLNTALPPLLKELNIAASSARGLLPDDCEPQSAVEPICTELRSLTLRGAGPSLPTLPPHLRHLGLPGFKGAELPDEVASLTHLESLDVSDSNLASLSSLPASLKRLDLSGSKITDLSPLGGLLALKELRICSTSIEDLTGLPDSLRILDTRDSAIEDLTALPKELKTLFLAAGRIGSLDGLPRSVRALGFGVDCPDFSTHTDPCLEALRK